MKITYTSPQWSSNAVLVISLLNSSNSFLGVFHIFLKFVETEVYPCSKSITVTVPQYNLEESKIFTY